MDPGIWAAIAQAATELTNTGIGLVSANVAKNKQRGWGRSMLEKAAAAEEAAGPSPTYNVPESYDKFLDYARTMVRQESPGYSLQKADIEQSSATALGSAQNLSGADAAAVTLGVNQDRLRALRMLGIQAAQYQDQRQKYYAGALAGRAQYEDQMFQYNQWIPWQQQMNRAMGYENMGRNAVYGSYDVGGAIGVQGANMLAQNSWSQFQNPNSAYNQGLNYWQPQPQANAGMGYMGQGSSGSASTPGFGFMQ